VLVGVFEANVQDSGLVPAIQAFFELFLADAFDRHALFSLCVQPHVKLGVWRQGRSSEILRDNRPMAREVKIGKRRFWIVSEPTGTGWTAQVLEVVDDLGGTQEVGIETTGETRSVADDRAVGQLQHRLRDQSF